MKYVKTNKIIAFILSMVMILSNVLPNLTSDVFGFGNVTDSSKSIEPVVEYSDSGQTEPERETTGTDLDNFNLYLDYGTISDKVSGDTLFVKDQSNKINATLRIEYTGDKVYNAGDLSMTFNYPTGIERDNPNYDMFSDVGAELKGSGSGRGDWYYTKKNGELTFTNKQATTGSFTSSIEIILEMPYIRQVISGFESTMNASFGVNGIDSVLNSKTLYFSTETTHDETYPYSITSSSYIYKYSISDPSKYNYKGYSLNDYYIMNVDFSSKIQLKNRGFISLDTYSLPDDCFFVDTNNNEYKYSENSDDHLSTDFRSKSIVIAIPKSKYNVGDNILVTWNKDVTFFDTNETYQGSLEYQIAILDNTIIREGKLFTINKNVSKNRVYFNELKENNGVDFNWGINLSFNQNLYDSTYCAPSYTEIIDDQVVLDGIRNFNEGEYYLNYIKFVPETTLKRKCDIKVYAKKFSDPEYSFIEQFTYNNEDVNIALDSEKKYEHFKIIIDGDWAAYKNFTLQIGAHLNLDNPDDYINSSSIYAKNTVNCNVTLNDETSDTDKAYSFIELIPIYARVDSNITSSKYSIKNDKLLYDLSFEGNNYVNKNDILLKTHKMSFDFSIPSCFDYNKITKDNFKISGKLYNSIGDTYIDTSSYYLPSQFYDVDFKIFQEGGEKIVKADITIKDGYYLYLRNYYFNTSIYMGFDTYSILENKGELPSYITPNGTNYKCEDFSHVYWKNESSFSEINLDIPSIAGNTYQGVEKFVNTGLGFTKDPSMTTAGGDYSYKLRIAGGETTLDNIVLYDNLEEAYGDNEYWKGTFNGLDTTLLDMICEGEGHNYTVYYSKDKNQAFDLSDAGWIKEADWTDALSDVKSIAIDLGDIRLNPKSLAYVIVNMKAPENTNPGLKAYNSYAADYKAYDSATGTLMETIKALPSNTTEVIYNKNITYTVNKIWNGKSSDSVEIKLFANGTEKETITLNADNKWTHTFADLPVLDDSFSPIEYTVEETPIKGYEISYNTKTDINENITSDITNTVLPFNHTVIKKWKNVEFPVPVIIKLMANGKVKAAVKMQEFKNNEQSYTFKDLPVYDDNGNKIEYTVVEKNIFDEMEYIDWIWYDGGMEYENLLYEYFNNKDGNVPDTQEYINSIYNNPNLTVTQKNYSIKDVPENYRDYITTENDKISEIINEIYSPTKFTINKKWNTNSEKIKLNVKTENGYDAEYDYINILDSDGSVLERIDFEKLGLVISKNEYKTDKTYTAEVHMKDGKVYKTSVNMDKFTKSPVECDLYVDGKVVDTFTLNEENGWKYTVTPSEKDNANAISLYSDDIIIDDDVIIVDPGDNPGGDEWEIHVYEDLDGVCSICGKTQEDGNHETIIDSDGDNTGTGNENTGSDNTGGDNTYHYHEYVDDNGICSVCGKTKDEGDHDKGVVHPKDEDDGIPEIPIDPHSVKEKTKGEWKTSITHTENGNNIDYTITNDVEHEIKIATITVSDPEPPVDTGNNNYLWIYFLTLGIGFAGILISRKKKQ